VPEAEPGLHAGAALRAVRGEIDPLRTVGEEQCAENEYDRRNSHDMFLF
jgi:hypothetical protein